MSRPLSTEPIFSWLSLVGIILLQALSGTRSIFSAYSSLLEQHLRISQVQLNNLIVALDIGKSLGCFSNAAANHLPMCIILFIGLIIGLVGYGVQYLYITNKIHSLSYWQVFLLNILAGNSICWIDTYCLSVAMRNFKKNHKTVIALASSYCALGGKLYTSLVEGIQERKAPQNSSIYLLLSCIAPMVIRLAVALLTSCQKQTENRETEFFPAAFLIAIATGVYAVIESVAPPFKQVSQQLRAVILVLVITLPLAVPPMTAAYQLKLGKWCSHVIPEAARNVSESHSKSVVEGIEISIDEQRKGDEPRVIVEGSKGKVVKVGVGNEHGVKELMVSLDFWLYFSVNACGTTLGMVYLNNLGRIYESRGEYEASFLLAISSIFGFFGRIFSVTYGWYTRDQPILPRTASMALLMIPMPVSFFLLISDSNICLYISTGILGTCSGAITGLNAATTSELFGPQNSIVNHNILLTNIPMGSLLFGYLAALNYEKEGGGRYEICIGLKCHYKTFIIWGSICSIGTFLSFILHLRTRKLYS